MVRKTTDELRAEKRQRQFHSARDFETSASQIGEIESLNAEAKRKAQLVVCSMVETAAEATEMLLMLGLHPSQPDFSDGPMTDPSHAFNLKGEGLSQKRRQS